MGLNHLNDVIFIVVMANICLVQHAVKVINNLQGKIQKCVHSHKQKLLSLHNYTFPAVLRGQCSSTLKILEVLAAVLSFAMASLAVDGPSSEDAASAGSAFLARLPPAPFDAPVLLLGGMLEVTKSQGGIQEG